LKEDAGAITIRNNQLASSQEKISQLEQELAISIESSQKAIEELKAQRDSESALQKEEKQTLEHRVEELQQLMTESELKYPYRTYFVDDNIF
jgi:hypothetical protein